MIRKEEALVIHVVVEWQRSGEKGGRCFAASPAQAIPLAWSPLEAILDGKVVVISRSTKRSSAAQRIALLTAEALGSFYSIAVHRWDGAALQTLRVGSQWWRRVGDRSIMASVRDSKRESRLRVLLMTCVYEATHAAFDLVKCQQQPRLIHGREVLTAAICLPQP